MRKFLATFFLRNVLWILKQRFYDKSFMPALSFQTTYLFFDSSYQRCISISYFVLILYIYIYEYIYILYIYIRLRSFSANVIASKVKLVLLFSKRTNEITNLWVCSFIAPKAINITIFPVIINVCDCDCLDFAISLNHI